MQKYLVTGGNGQVGMALRALLPVEFASYVKTRESLDITHSRNAVARILALRPDAVINCAAYTNVRAAERDVQKAWQVNAWAVGKLAAGLAEAGIPLIHISTDFVFGQEFDRKTPYTEMCPPGPVNSYGASKLAGEAAIFQVANHYPDWRFFIVRTAGVFEAPWRNNINFANAMATRVARKDTLRGVTDVVSSITYAPDLAKCLVFLASRPHEISSGCYHVVNQGFASWYQIANYLQEQLCGRPMPVATITSQQYEQQQGHDASKVATYTALSVDKFKTLPEAPVLPCWQQALRTYAKLWRRLQ
jgi:dTDP-4-dehydrorhamnose reductase